MSEEKVEYPTGREVIVTPQETQEFDFYGDVLLIALVENVPYVAIRPIADGLGIEWAPQYQRILRDDILNEERRLVVMVGGDGKKREMVTLPLEMLPGWLFGISGSRTKKPDVVEKLKRYRRECFRVLWREFGTRGVVPEVQNVSALQQVREMGLALMQMADEQIALQGQVETVTLRTDEAHARLDKAAEVVKGFQRRLTTVERRMLPYECISSEQATEVRLAVQRLGELLTGKAVKSRQPGEKVSNFYSSIFTEIYTRTGAPRYELIRLEDYAGVMRFLEEWRKSATLSEEKESESESSS